MSTRGAYIFSDGERSFAIYNHTDNYPTGGQHLLAKWFEDEASIRWREPRFEADEAAAAFVAYNKDTAGGVRLMHQWNEAWDIAYLYKVYPAKHNGQIILELWDIRFDETLGPIPDTRLYYGRVKDFTAQVAERIEKDEAQEDPYQGAA